MTSLREELGVDTDTAPTPYGILCPPGWRRTRPEELLEGPRTQAALDRMKAAGRADLVLQTRSMLAQFRRSIRELKVVDLYLPPADPEDGPLPASLMVSPLVRPATASWDAALARLAKGAEVQRADFAETPMWVWRRVDSVADSETTLATRESHFVVPVSDAASARRALRFQFTVLVPPTSDGEELAESLVRVGDVMMSTMRWLPLRSADAS